MKKSFVDNDWPTVIDVLFRLWDGNNPFIHVFLATERPSAVMMIHSSVTSQTNKEVYSRQMLSGEHYNGFEEQESHNKWTVFFTTNSTPRTE